MRMRVFILFLFFILREGSTRAEKREKDMIRHWGRASASNSWNVVSCWSTLTARSFSDGNSCVIPQQRGASPSSIFLLISHHGVERVYTVEDFDSHKGEWESRQVTEQIPTRLFVPRKCLCVCLCVCVCWMMMMIGAHTRSKTRTKMEEEEEESVGALCWWWWWTCVYVESRKNIKVHTASHLYVDDTSPPPPPPPSRYYF